MYFLNFSEQRYENIISFENIRSQIQILKVKGVQQPLFFGDKIFQTCLNLIKINF